MTSSRKYLSFELLVLLTMWALGTCLPVSAQQVTTGNIAGVVMDAQKAVMPGVFITAVHVPTGTTYDVVTNADGRFAILAVRVGGPYTVKAAMTGFKTEEQSEIQVGLGQTRALEITLQVAAITETVTVVSEVQVIDTSRAGTAENLGAQQVEALPSISRSLFDIARTSPYVNTNADSLGSISVAGRNNRYNNMQIDGAVNNDVFGLASSGTPGGQTGTQPISLDAIQEVQLVVSPYDVRQGGFSGGGVNAVTKSGTNSLHGTAYYFMRNQDWIRTIPGIKTVANPNPSGVPYGTFTDRQVGFSVGGPVVKNRLFFFTNLDWARKNTPAGYSLDGKSGQTWSDAALVPQVINIAKTKYGFDPGGLEEFTKPNNSNKTFVRIDYNLSQKHQLTGRTNYVDALANLGSQSNTAYKMPGNFYSMTDKMLSNVVQLNSSFGTAFNELRVTYQRERNIRGDQPEYKTFPEVRVDFPSGNYIYLGSEYSSQANKLNQDIVEVTDDLTLVRGSHTISLGTHNEFYKFWNLFIQYYNGGYRFSSAANFEAGIAQSFNHNFSKTSNPLEAAAFSVRQFGLYAGDQWRAKSNLMFTYGLRIDLPRFPDKPHANPVTVTDFGFATDVVPAPTMWSPRFGFNWDLSGGTGRRSQLRGGLGIFTGRTPYVWLSNQYGNTGVDFTNLSITYNAGNKIAFVPDPLNQPTTVTGGTTGRQTVNMIDPDYKFPMILRTNFGYDHDLRFLGFTGTAEFVFTKNLKEIAYQNRNYVPTGTLVNGRNTYKKLDSNLNDAMLLSNTSAGRTWSLSYKVDRRFARFFTSASYLYGRSYAVNDGTSSVARSNWANNPISVDMNNPSLVRSYYDVGHRINISGSVPIRLFKGLQSTTSVIATLQSGRPYNLAFNGDVNGDAVLNNDLLYVPSSASDIVVYSSVTGQAATYDQLMAFLDSTAAKDYHGQIIPRNAGSTPWVKDLSFRFAVAIPFKESVRAEISLDVLNFLNLLNNQWGWSYFGGFPASTSIGYGGVDAATGKMKYNLNTINSTTFQGVFSRDDTLSRAQAQLGIRFRF